ncbi:hypothetical protein ACJ41O_011792 [Fusarium nematophilum]
MKLLSLLTFATLSLAQLYAAPIIEQIAPNSKSCPSDNTDCRTAAQAAPHIVQGLSRYGIYSLNEMAAVISLMAFESVDFKYKHNISPGRPGQGTANMQLAGFNLLYAKQIPGVGDELAGVESVDGMSDAELDDLLALVTPDEHNFGSGPWFLATQCDEGVRTALKEDVDEGFKAYMGCVDADATEERLAYLERAKEAFGL